MTYLQANPGWREVLKDEDGSGNPLFSRHEIIGWYVPDDADFVMPVLAHIGIVELGESLTYSPDERIPREVMAKLDETSWQAEQDYVRRHFVPPA